MEEVWWNQVKGVGGEETPTTLMSVVTGRLTIRVTCVKSPTLGRHKLCH